MLGVVLHGRRFSYNTRSERTSSSCAIVFHLSLCQCGRDIPKIANSCLTWTAHGTYDNGRVQTLRVVVIAWQWTGSDIESRRHCLHQVRGYVPAQSSYGSDSRIRALPVLLYSSAITSGAQPRAETSSPEHGVLLFVWFEAHPNTGSFSIEDLPKDVIFRQNEVTRARGTFSLIGVRICNFHLVWSSFEHGVFAFSFWLLHFCLAASKWLGGSLSPWPPHLAGSNWSSRLQRPIGASLPQWPSFGQVAWTSRSHRRILAAGTKRLRFRWYGGHCFVRGIGLPADGLIESNCCRVSAFKSAFRRRLKSFSMRSRFRPTEAFLCLHSDPFCCICTPIGGTTKLLLLPCLHTHRGDQPER